MLSVMISVEDKKEEIISPLTGKLMYDLENDLEDEPNNDLLSAKEQLSSNDKDNDNKEKTTAETK